MLRTVFVMVLLVAGAGIACTAEPSEPPELAVLMATLQRHSHKLGLAVRERNEPLASFYIHEVEEALGDVVTQIPTHDGLDIRSLIKTISMPTVGPLAEHLKAANWQEAELGYRTLIDGCNRCHAATEHEFLVITHDLGENPYNQKFSIP